MSASDRVGYDGYFVLPEIQVEGVPFALRAAFNFTTSVVVVTDDEPNNAIKIPFPGGGGGSFSVTGSGFPVVIGGVLQPAAKLVANGDVDTNANIAVTKLAGAGTDGYSLRRSSGVTAWGPIDLSNANAVTGLGTSGDLLYNNAGAVGALAHVSYDATLGLSVGVPFGGDASSPFAWRTVTLTAVGGNVNLSAAQAACPEIIITSTAATTFFFPTSKNGEHHFIRNGNATTTWAATGQTGTTFNSTVASGWVYFNGTDYKKEGT